MVNYFYILFSKMGEYIYTKGLVRNTSPSIDVTWEVLAQRK
nr:MAG TPA: hypothetical protein [Bacteriophage sp.]